MKKRLFLLFALLICVKTICFEGFQLIIINQSGIQIDLFAGAYKDGTQLADEQEVIKDKFGLFWFANKGEKVKSFCIANKKTADSAEIYWKYMGALGIKTLDHVKYIEPLEGQFVLYIFKDGLIALHNVTKNVWEYERVPMQLTQFIPGVKEIVKEQDFVKNDFVKEVHRIARMLNEEILDDLFSLPESVQEQLEVGECK